MELAKKGDDGGRFNALQTEWSERERACRAEPGGAVSALWPRMSLPVINLDRIIDAVPNEWMSEWTNELVFQRLSN